MASFMSLVDSCCSVEFKALEVALRQANGNVHHFTARVVHYKYFKRPRDVIANELTNSTVAKCKCSVTILPKVDWFVPFVLLDFFQNRAFFVLSFLC